MTPLTALSVSLQCCDKETALQTTKLRASLATQFHLENRELSFYEKGSLNKASYDEVTQKIIPIKSIMN